VLHVTSDGEANESGQRVSRRAAVIPNGVEIPAELHRTCGNGALRLLFLGRLDPKKGIENLLLACNRLKLAEDAWHLTIAGGGEPAYGDSLRLLIEKLGLQHRVKMTGEVVGAERERIFSSSDVCIVPSFTENFGMVVAEALARAIPVIASRGTPWSRIENFGCGIWTDNDPDSLVAAIVRISSQDLADMGQKGRSWMQAEYSWDGIATQMTQLYCSQLKMV
jgi:glycosyltransferase involved in cell wall biosynthesis